MLVRFQVIRLLLILYDHERSAASSDGIDDVTCMLLVCMAMFTVHQATVLRRVIIISVLAMLMLHALTYQRFHQSMLLT